MELHLYVMLDVAIHSPSLANDIVQVSNGLLVKTLEGDGRTAGQLIPDVKEDSCLTVVARWHVDFTLVNRDTHSQHSIVFAWSHSSLSGTEKHRMKRKQGKSIYLYK